MEVKPGYKQTEVGVIPEEWDLAQIAEVADVKTGPFGSALHERDYVHDGTPIITVEHLNELGVTHFNLPMVSDADCRRLRGYSLEADDIVFSRVGSVDRNALIREAEAGWLFSGRLLRVRPNQRKALAPYLSHQFHSEPFKRRVRDVAVGQTMASLNTQILKNVTVVLPTILEQCAIAAALSDVDTLISALDKLITKKRDIKQAAMQQLLAGRKRLPGFHGEWRTKTLGKVMTRCFSGATPRRNRPDYFKGNIRWITSGELNYNLITDTAEKLSSEAVDRTNLKIVPKGTFLMAITGLEAEGTRGSCGIVGEPATTNQSCMAIFPTSELVTEYLFHYYVFRGKALALQYCQGTKQQSYTTKLVKQLPIALPPTTTEQTAIAEVLSDMDAELAALEQRRDKTRLLKQGMMQELLTGKTRLPFDEGTPYVA